MQVTIRGKNGKINKILIKEDNANMIITSDEGKVLVYDNMVIIILYGENNRTMILAQPLKEILVEGERIEQQ